MEWKASRLRKCWVLLCLPCSLVAGSAFAHRGVESHRAGWLQPGFVSPPSASASVDVGFQRPPEICTSFPAYRSLHLILTSSHHWTLSAP